MTKKAKGKRAGKTRASKTKSEQVEVRSSSSAQYKLPEGPRLAHHLANVEGWEAKLTDLKASIKKQYEAAASEGIPKALLKELMDLKGGDPIVARQRLESFGVGLKVIGAPFQLNVFDTMWASDIDQAKAEAISHARNGKSMECRFAEGSEAHGVYVETYMAEQAKLVPGADQLTDEEREAALKPEAEEGEGVKAAEPVKPAKKLELVH